MSLEILNADIETCIEPFYKKRLSLIKSLVGNKVLDALLYMPTGIIETLEISTLSKELVNKNIIATVKVEFIEYAFFSKTRPITVTCSVGNTQVELLFFNYKPCYLKGTFDVGKIVKIVGKLSITHNGRYQIVNPKKATFKTKQGISNVYPLRTGITQYVVTSVINLALTKLCNTNITEWLPQEILDKYNFYSFCGSLLAIHKPQISNFSLLNNVYRQRLCFDEIFAEQLAIQISKAKRIKPIHASEIQKPSRELVKQLITTLPFKLTSEQLKAYNEITLDMSKTTPMHRLLQGDVGSGKTIIAILAMLHAIELGYQCAILAPTEILARQHLKLIQKYIDGTGVNISIITSNEKGRARKQILECVSSGITKILVGTHAIFNDKLAFKNLGLVVVDEQHRFGVGQRLALIEKGENPHILSMTATPIPRTTIMSMYGDIDTSSITQKPIGRKNIVTKAIGMDRIATLIEAIRRIIDKGQKVYWICPLIEDSEKLDYTCVIERFDYLFKHFNNEVDMLHGKMSTEEKRDVFDKFISGKTHVLVSTTVIEVGIDVSDATVIIIENAEKFGLAQLHQLRGRVGRSELQSYCMLLYDKSCSHVAKQRIKIMTQTNDGFIIAEEDLKLRGGGEVYGTKQSEHKQYKTFNITSAMEQELINEYIITSNRIAKLAVQNGSVELYENCLKIFKPEFHENVKLSF